MRRMTAVRWTLLCAAALAISELVVLGVIPLTGESWYYRAPGWHDDLLDVMLITFAGMVGMVWLVVLPALAVRDWRNRKRR